MPYIAVVTSQNVSADQADALKTALGALIPTVPGKTEEFLMVNVSGGNTMYFSGRKKPCAFIDMRVFRHVDTEAKDKFAAAVIDLVARSLGIPPDDTFFAMAEYNSWGLKGAMRHEG